MIGKLGRFELLKSIAIGGMAEIYLAKQKGLEGFEKLVVIKKILPEMGRRQDFVQLFLNEARLAARLNHPNIVQIYDLGFSSGSYFIAMEYVQGENLGTIWKHFRNKDAVIPLAHAIKIMIQVCEGLFYAHSKKDVSGNLLRIVHCDISPQNILLSFDGVVKIVDFGIAKASTHRPQRGPVKGKPAYMSPEQIRNQPLDPRSDIFSLGIVLWELLAGKRMFGKIPWPDIVKRIVSGKIPSLRDEKPLLPERWETITRRALASKPDNRFQNASQLHMALEQGMKEEYLESSPFHLSKLMSEHFGDKLLKYQQLEQARESGNLHSFLFDDLFFSLPDSDAEISSPIQIKPQKHHIQKPKVHPLPIARDYSPTDFPSHYRKGRFFKRMLLDVMAMILVVTLGLVVLLFHPTAVTLAEQWLEKAISLMNDGPSLGSVRIISSPPGAQASVGTEPPCTTPCHLYNLSLGKEQLLHISFPQHHQWIHPLLLTKEHRNQQMNVSLTPSEHIKTGKAKIITWPSGAMVELNGKKLNDSTPLLVPSLKAYHLHRLLVTLPNHEVWAISFGVKPGRQATIRATLKPSAQVK